MKPSKSSGRQNNARRACRWGPLCSPCFRSAIVPPVLGILPVSAVLAPLVRIGPLLSVGPLKPKLAKLIDHQAETNQAH